MYDEQETETQVLTIDTEIQTRVNPTGEIIFLFFYLYCSVDNLFFFLSYNYYYIIGVVLLRATPIKRKIEKILPIGIFT